MLPERIVPEDETIELLVKPYAPRVLLDRVRAALARRAEGRLPRPADTPAD
jgi:DNA-binding response OmpR family regulator